MDCSAYACSGTAMTGFNLGVKACRSYSVSSSRRDTHIFPPTYPVTLACVLATTPSSHPFPCQHRLQRRYQPRFADAFTA